MATQDGAKAELGSARILLVDDSALVRAIVGRGLKRAGMQVDEARSAAEALEQLGARSYDVVISDLCMPAFDDFALLTTIKAQSPATEVIILSGLEDIERAMEALKLGAHAYLAKPPAHPEEVLLTVRRALETKRLRDLCDDLQRPRRRAVA
jgi:DNA-binding NtrC family response regulator